mmetsp:Transcript_13928/g.58129  ORF Transcript_13928/g.58129 Transcript_13928/m.58129 type:complete len:311 (-) Transcript_13928:1152-2084(-)
MASSLTGNKSSSYISLSICANTPPTVMPGGPLLAATRSDSASQYSSTTSSISTSSSSDMTNFLSWRPHLLKTSLSARSISMLAPPGGTCAHAMSRMACSTPPAQSAHVLLYASRSAPTSSTTLSSDRDCSTPRTKVSLTSERKSASSSSDSTSDSSSSSSPKPAPPSSSLVSQRSSSATSTKERCGGGARLAKAASWSTFHSSPRPPAPTSLALSVPALPCMPPSSTPPPPRISRDTASSISSSVPSSSSGCRKQLTRECGSSVKPSAMTTPMLRIEPSPTVTFSPTVAPSHTMQCDSLAPARTRAPLCT